MFSVTDAWALYCHTHHSSTQSFVCTPHWMGTTNENFHLYIELHLRLSFQLPFVNMLMFQHLVITWPPWHMVMCVILFFCPLHWNVMTTCICSSSVSFYFWVEGLCVIQPVLYLSWYSLWVMIQLFSCSLQNQKKCALEQKTTCIQPYFIWHDTTGGWICNTGVAVSLHYVVLLYTGTDECAPDKEPVLFSLLHWSITPISSVGQ